MSTPSVHIEKQLSDWYADWLRSLELDWTRLMACNGPCEMRMLILGSIQTLACKKWMPYVEEISRHNGRMELFAPLLCFAVVHECIGPVHFFNTPEGKNLLVFHTRGVAMSVALSAAFENAFEAALEEARP